MTRAERIVDGLVMAYLGAVLTLMLMPVLGFMAALRVADWLDKRYGNVDTPQGTP